MHRLNQIILEATVTAVKADKYEIQTNYARHWVIRMNSTITPEIGQDVRIVGSLQGGYIKEEYRECTK